MFRRYARSISRVIVTEPMRSISITYGLVIGEYRRFELCLGNPRRPQSGSFVPGERLAELGPGRGPEFEPQCRASGWPALDHQVVDCAREAQFRSRAAFRSRGVDRSRASVSSDVLGIRITPGLDSGSGPTAQIDGFATPRSNHMPLPAPPAYRGRGIWYYVPLRLDTHSPTDTEGGCFGPISGCTNHDKGSYRVVWRYLDGRGR